jgi:glucosamine-6-phosphate deaminase
VTRIVVLPTARAAGDALARFVARALTTSPNLVLGLPTGRTPLLFYDAIARLHEQGSADFRRATTFNLDEFAGLAATDPRSFHAFMKQHLFDRVNLSPLRRHVLNGSARSWQKEIVSFDRKLADAGGLDFAILGIGANGHVAFNEPGPSLGARTHRARLSDTTRRANAWAFDGRWRDVPRYALTLGMGSILGARGVLLLATGEHKAGIVARAFAGPITTRVPASLLQAHPNVVIVLDRDAAAKLPVSLRR